MADDDVEVEPLRLSRKPKPKKVKVRNEHGTLYLHIPKKWAVELGLFLASEVAVEKVGVTPLSWELRIKPLTAKKKA